MNQDQLNQDARGNPPAQAGSIASRLATANIMQRVRMKMALRRVEQHAAQAEIRLRAATSRPLPHWQPAEPRLESKSGYKLAELLRFDDVDFIETAYRTLLKRAPDPAGSGPFLSMLRDGHIGKVEILGLIRFSEEGRQRGVHVEGLLLPYKVHKWRHKRVIGPLLGFAVAVLRLPRLALHLQALAARSARESRELGDLLNRCEAVIDQRHADIEAALNDLLDDLNAKLTKSGSLWIDVASKVESHIDSLDQSLLSQEQAHARTDLAISGLRTQADRDQRSLRALLDRVTVFLDEAARSRSGKPGDARQGESPLETQYVSFEDAFRGERGEIKKRVAHYLGTLKDAGIEPDDGLVLDLGSGRGEWLEVLTEQGYACRGVDLNRGMLKESTERGYDVVETDAIGYLRILADGSVAAITSMHLVEHVPHPVLIDLLDESLRVLRPGGILILETPNPENVRVGSCQFYMDPTHLHPIPPLLLQWVVGSRGFADAVIERLSEHRGAPDLLPVSGEVPGAGQINQMIEWFTAPPDYAVIARKPVGG